MPSGDFRALAEVVGAGLSTRGAMLATAESCTGGMIAAAITEIGGCSGWFDGGFVTYSNEAKIGALGVPEALIAQFGAVSEQVAAAMAEGALAHSGAGFALSVTGVAGPGGGSLDKPVGMICFGWAVRGQPAVTETMHFPGDRAAVRAESVRYSLQGLLNRLDSYPSWQ